MDQVAAINLANNYLKRVKQKCPVFGGLTLWFSRPVSSVRCQRVPKVQFYCLPDRGCERIYHSRS